jgi:ribonuclease P protein component
LEKKFRIKKNIEIQQLMQRKQTVGNIYFILYYQENHEITNFRFALSVSKKYGKAHKRNLIKRRLREIIKTYDFKDNFEFFIVARLKAESLSFLEIKQNIDGLFKKANLLKRGSDENKK